MYNNNNNNNNNNRRTPNVVKISNSGIVGNNAHNNFCPKCGWKMQFDRINVKDWICTKCNFVPSDEIQEQEEEKREQEQQHNNNSNPTQPIIATIDGWVDVGVEGAGRSYNISTIPKMRPFEGDRKDAIVNRKIRNPIMHPDTRKFMQNHPGVKITSIEEVIEPSMNGNNNMLELEKYRDLLRRRQL